MTDSDQSQTGNQDEQNPEPEHAEYKFGDNYEGDSVVKVWCDGREYDPSTEAYHPRYAYSIVTPKWRYDGNDIRGARNELPDIAKASQSLFAFLYASQESYERHTAGAFTDGNHTMFPKQVNEWAHHFSDKIGAFNLEFQVHQSEVPEITE